MRRSSAPPVRVVDPFTKRHLILLLYHIMEQNSKEKGEPLPNYGQMHKAVKILQEFLESSYGLTLGYKFKDGGISSIYNIWDKELQRDLERYDALGKVVDNADIAVEKGYYAHELKVRNPIGTFLLETNVKDNLQKQLGNIDELIRNIKFRISQVK